MNDNLKSALKRAAESADEALDGFLPRPPAAPARLAEAMRYSVFAGGKRFRPALVLFVSDALGGRAADAMPAACALEMVHTYSLIHDDLPAMDDDDLRRGKPSSHKAFGEATAILAGDALLTFAFEVAAGSPEGTNPVRLCRELARAAGPEGMVAGQAADVAGEGAAGSIEDVEYIHLRKTAALISAAAKMGAITAGAGEEKAALAGEFGVKLGLLFQITDDILDETAETGLLGKTAGKDAAAGKLTYPAVIGLDGARARAAELAREALCILEELAPSNTILSELVTYVQTRTF